MGFVGREFDSGMVDDRNLFVGETSDRVIYDAFAHVRYADGVSELRVTPDSIVLSSTSEDVLPDILVTSARKVSEMIDSSGKGQSVDAVNVRCSAIMPSGRPVEEVFARTFCRSFIVEGKLEEMIGENDVLAMQPRVVFSQGEVFFDLRIEPHFSSGGGDLYFHMESLQSVQSGHLGEVLDSMDLVRSRIQDVMGRVTDRLVSTAGVSP